jgi:O-antigen ligase
MIHQSPTDHTDRLNAWLILPLTAVLAYTAFQWGGVERSGRYGILLALGLLALAAGRRARWTALLLPAYVLLQIIPLPLAALRVFSPQRAQMLDALVPVGAGTGWASLSVFPAATFQYFLLVCAYLAVFLLVRQAAWRTVWPLLGIAALEAALGIWQHFAGAADEMRRGTYANRNHFAGLLEMVLPFAVMYAVALSRRGRSALAACAAWALAGLLFIGIVYSFSRMGFVAALFSLFVMGALAGPTRRRWVAAGLLVALALGAFVFLPPDALILRFAQLASADGLTANGRTDLWSNTLPLIRAYLPFGCGLGGYETAFYPFKKSGPLVTDDFAHNDYLQLLAELGIPGFLIVAAGAFWIARRAVRGALGLQDPEQRYFALACAGALAAILLHSTVDFNLYIPANVMVLMWIAGMTAALDTGAVRHPANICKTTKTIDVRVIS